MLTHDTAPLVVVIVGPFRHGEGLRHFEPALWLSHLCNLLQTIAFPRNRLVLSELGSPKHAPGPRLEALLARLAEPIPCQRPNDVGTGRVLSRAW